MSSRVNAHNPDVTAADRASAEALLERLYCHSHVEAAKILATALATVRADSQHAMDLLDKQLFDAAQRGVALQARVAALEAALEALGAGKDWRAG